MIYCDRRPTALRRRRLNVDQAPAPECGSGAARRARLYFHLSQRQNFLISKVDKSNVKKSLISNYSMYL